MDADFKFHWNKLPHMDAKIDKKDLQILELLKKNSKLTSQHISKKTLIPVTTVHNRVKKMEKTGVIKGYSVVLDHKKLGKDILAFILLTTYPNLPDGRKVMHAEVAKELDKHPSLTDIHVVAGVIDIILKVRAKNIDELSSIIEELRNVEGVDTTQTMVVLHSV